MISDIGAYIMTDYSKYHLLPLGSITASGWIKEQLIRSRDGMGGHLDELEPQMILYPYTTKETDEKWGGVAAGWGAEISGNYWFGLVNLAFTLSDGELIEKAEKWVDAVLKNKEEEGYLGAYKESDDRFDDYNAWGTACGMRAQLAYYEATGRQDVFDAVYSCMLWFVRNWSGEKKTRYAGCYIIDPMIYCWHVTHDDRLYDFCVEYQNFLREEELFNNSAWAFAEKKLQYNSNHSSAYACDVRLPAMIYTADGNGEWLDASLNGLDKLLKKATNPTTGGIVCNNEYLAPVSPECETEYCSFAYLAESYEVIGAAAGTTKYGDYLEEMVYNAAEGARKKDEKAIAYNSSPNEIYCDRNSSHFTDIHTLYAPVHPVSCCAVNSVAVIPLLLRGMAMTDGENNLRINCYGPCVIRHMGAEITCDTLYPFRNTIRYTFGCDEPVTFGFAPKKPYWCKNMTVTVNGEPTDDELITREWQDGDTVEITLEAKPKVIKIKDRAGNKPLAVKYGALAFSLPLREKWININSAGFARTPLPDGWAWYAIHPEYDSEPNVDKYDIMGWRKYWINWNYALDRKEAEGSITVCETEPDGYVWEKPPIRIEIDGWKAPYSYASYPAKTNDFYEKKQPVTDKKRLTLVPYGCTALRITYFPRADV